MTSNPNSLAVLTDEDGNITALICETCVQWTALGDLHVDDSGDRWDVCQWCFDGSERPWQAAEHGECDCVPDLGPSHCHLCGLLYNDGQPVVWSDALLYHARMMPPELCGIGGCVFTPHAEVFPHSWEPRG
jgi:hypothetical protein